VISEKEKEEGGRRKEEGGRRKKEGGRTKEERDCKESGGKRKEVRYLDILKRDCILGSKYQVASSVLWIHLR
jgi:hypothetical protein